jgi:hypothetical protein
MILNIEMVNLDFRLWQLHAVSTSRVWVFTLKIEAASEMSIIYQNA